jgi:hypothetical protein
LSDKQQSIFEKQETMTSFKTYFLASALLCGLFAVSQGFLYHIYLTTGYDFQPRNASVFVIVSSNDVRANMSMPGPIQLFPNKLYSAAVDVPIPAPKLSFCNFQWIDRSRTGSAVVTLKNVTIVPFYIQNPDSRRQMTKVFCTKGPLRQLVVTPLPRC